MSRERVKIVLRQKPQGGKISIHRLENRLNAKKIAEDALLLNILSFSFITFLGAKSFIKRVRVQ